MADLTFDIFAKENVSEALDKIADKLKDSEGNFSKWAIAGGVAGGAIGGALIAGISGALDMQSSNAKLAAQLGATGPEAAAYGKIAGKLYSQNYGESLDDVNDAIVKVNQNIAGIGQDELPDVTARVMDLSSAFGSDLSASTAAVGQLLKTGLAPNAKAALDVITAGMQGGANKADDFLETLNEYPVQFQKLGLDAKAATGLLSQGLQAGARDSDLVADSLKEFSIRAVDGSATTKAGFEALGLSAQDMAGKIAAGGPTASAALQLTLDKLRAIEDPVKRSAAAVSLFGSQAEDMGKALYSLDPSKAVSALGQVDGAADRLDKTLGSTGQANLATFARTMQTTFVEQVGGRALPVVMGLTGALAGNLAPAFSTAGSAVAAVTGFYERHQVLVQSVGIAVGILALAVGAAALVQGIQTGALMTWLSATTVARTATGAYTAVQWALNAAMSANPIGIVVVALAAVAAGLIYAYQHSETFRNIVDGTLHAVGGWFSWLGGVIGGWAGDVKDWLVDKVGDHVRWLQEKFTAFKAGLDVALGGARTAIGWIKDKASEVKDWVGANWPLLLAILTGPFGLAVLTIAKHWTAIVDGGKDVVTWVRGLPASVSGALGSVFSPLWEGFRTNANKIIGKWNSLSFTLGGGSFMGVSIPSFTIDTPNLPMLATGGTAVAPGLSIVGERGPELAYLPTGASVIPLPRVADAAAAAGSAASDPGTSQARAADRAEAAAMLDRLDALETALARLPKAIGAELLDALRRA